MIRISRSQKFEVWSFLCRGETDGRNCYSSVALGTDSYSFPLQRLLCNLLETTNLHPTDVLDLSITDLSTHSRHGFHPDMSTWIKLLFIAVI